MSERVKRFKRRQKTKKNSKCQSPQSYPFDTKMVNLVLSGKTDAEGVDRSGKKLREAYSIDWRRIKVSESEVEDFINRFNTKETAIDSIIEPVFLSLIDGSMRAFKIGTKQGLTASRIYKECKSFNYDDDKYVDSAVDRYTEYNNEKADIKDFDSQSEYKGGKFTREGEEDLAIRDQPKMDAYKNRHFADGANDTSEDEYSPGEEIFKDNKTAFEHEGISPEGKETHYQSAETDHIIPCAILCKELKSNKALNPNDIKDILNDDANLAVTSFDTNRGIGGKFDSTNEEWVAKHGENLPPSQRETMLKKSKEARAAISTNTNKKVLKNISTDGKVQLRLAKGAAQAAGHRAVGDIIIFFMKPLYYELNDCMRYGIEKGVNANSFQDSLKVRLGRISNYIENKLKDLPKEGGLNFIRSFFSMLIEGILNCFVGIFKHIVRAVSEGTRLMIGIIPILKDNTISDIEKGDAILKIVAVSATALAGIGIESFLNSMGLPEPWSIILASILSTVITALVMYSLDKMDLFDLKRNVKNARILEALELISMGADEKFKNLIDPSKKFRELQGI